MTSLLLQDKSTNKYSPTDELNTLIHKYPQFPYFVMLKTDIQRRGIYYTQAALEKADPTIHQMAGTHIFGTRDGILTHRPEAFMLRDGTSVLTTPTPLEQNPYIVDLRNDKLTLVDGQNELEEIEYWTKPDFYNQKTKSGIPMNLIASARPQRIYIMPNRYCFFWSNKQNCLFCDIVNNLQKQKKELHMPTRLDPDDVEETVKEALKQNGRFTAICLTSGSDYNGNNAFDRETDYYIEILKAIGKNFKTKKFPSQLIATAFNSEQLGRLYEQTGILSYTPDIEVLNERLFNWLCPGKAHWVGYKEWKKRLKDAVPIFGRGYVNTCIVAGIELAQPYGFKDEDEALKNVLTEAEDLISSGVNVVFTVWAPRPGSVIGNQKNASLEYYIRLALGLHNLRKKYGLRLDHDDYRRCGNHPDSDLARIL
ncbi:radical SAM protein [Pectinatus cerevisiiphilus]|uniref:Biotin synthase-related radical SAM superfamily protein n=1 Tax=Pectinatus cerevisiiphilus TaxID=86956 RepID=A0A4R3KAT9_9FIRM|nr:radical SAM protein [Pectinatus cerevisiiphilus]TCS80095.1 biotin synthase-related radical SAM superfamily protein [Pectinatus cerevisiiphilus]